MGLVLDTGGLIAFDRGDRQVAALLEAARRKRERVVTSSGSVAQAWRGGGSRHALLARLLRGATEVALDRRISRATGDLCATSKTTDVVDAHVALIALDGDVVLTSDVSDLRRLLRARGVRGQVLRC
ncbi:MAG: PIN domain nuclease [Acidimicrobiia bacterium]|nr:PIN domain nuclease [Acidimicrobiia bacterium]